MADLFGNILNGINPLLGTAYNALPGNTGSWFGIKDFGLTENAAKIASGGQTTDLSDALTGNYTSPTMAQTVNYGEPDPLPQTGGGTTGGSTLEANTSTPPLNNTQNPTLQTIQPQYNQALYSQVNNQWDSYINSLDQLLSDTGDGSLTAQKNSQIGLANSQFDTALGDLKGDQAIGLRDLGTQRTKTAENQSKSLRDISTNLKNSWQAGNNFLGTRGAGDSSAADQYAFALTKAGNRQRADIQSQYVNIFNDINDREFKLNTIFTQEEGKLKTARDQRIGDINIWFTDATNSVKEAIRQGQLSKQQDITNIMKNIYDQALSQINQTNQDISSTYDALKSWAISNSANIGQLKTNLASIQGYAPQMPSAPKNIFGNPTVDSTGNIFTPLYGYGSNDKEKEV